MPEQATSGEGPAPRQPLSRNTSITVGAALGAVVFLFTGFGWVTTNINNVRDEVQGIRTEVRDGLRDIGTRVERIEERRDEAWTRQAQVVWALKLERENPTLKVPSAE